MCVKMSEVCTQTLFWGVRLQLDTAPFHADKTDTRNFFFLFIAIVCVSVVWQRFTTNTTTTTTTKKQIDTTYYCTHFIQSVCVAYMRITSHTSSIQTLLISRKKGSLWKCWIFSKSEEEHFFDWRFVWVFSSSSSFIQLWMCAHEYKCAKQMYRSASTLERMDARERENDRKSEKVHIWAQIKWNQNSNEKGVMLHKFIKFWLMLASCVAPSAKYRTQKLPPTTTTVAIFRQTLLCVSFRSWSLFLWLRYDIYKLIHRHRQINCATHIDRQAHHLSECESSK